jgi:hypothetical protein
VAQKKSRNRNVKPVLPATEGRRRSLLWGGVVVAIVVVAGALLFAYKSPHPNPLPGGEGKSDLSAAAQYVGSTACASCHDKEAIEWRESQQHDAMAQATEQSVLGNFNNAAFASS